jgi:hypothetical protein
MSLADFNKDNPFVIIVRKLEDVLYKDVMLLTKKLYILTIIMFLTSVASMVLAGDFIPLIFSSISIMYNITSWKSIVTKGEFANVNKLIYGDEFSAINVNNEKLFETIQSMNMAKGELSNYGNKLYYDFIIILSLMSYTILNIFIER